MDNKSFSPDNIPADLDKSWHIPRPTLARSSKSSQGSTSSNNSTQSAKSGSLLLTAANLAQIQNQQIQQQTALLVDSTAITTRNQNIQYYLEQTNHKNNDLLALQINNNDVVVGGSSNNNMMMTKPDPDSVSLASSMHFTVVNMNTRPVVRQRSFCRKHQLTILVMTMSALILIGILIAIFLLEVRAKRRY